MTLISQATKGKIQKPHLVLIYGISGVGKSTFGADAPKPFFISSEKGTSNLDVTRVSPKSFEEVLQILKELNTEKHDYQTLVIDSLDWTETLVFDKVVREAKKADIKNIEDIGYAKGYIFALTYWREIISAVSALQDNKHMNVVLIAHSEVKTFQDPLVQGGYDRFQMKMHHKAAALFTEFVDCLLFATFELSTLKDESKKTRAYADGTRVIYTESRAGFHAKNRFGLPFEMPLSWAEYDNAVKHSSPIVQTESMKASIQEMLTKVKDEKIIGAVKSELEKSPSPDKLLKIQNKLQTLTSGVGA